MGFRFVRDELYIVLDKRKVIFGGGGAASASSFVFGLLLLLLFVFVNGLVQMQIPAYQEYVCFGWIERVTLLIRSPLKTSMQPYLSAFFV